MKAILYKSGKLVEGVLTFIELRQLFDEMKIQEKLVKMSEFDPPHGNWGALYPLPAGIIQAGGIKRDMVTSSVITASGKEDVLEAINDLTNILIQFIIILTCFFARDVFWGRQWSITTSDSEEGALVRQVCRKKV